MGIIKLLLLVAALACTPSDALCASIQYIGTGRPTREVKITFSRNKGVSWQNAIVKPGQTFVVPKDATHLTIDGAPRDPAKDYKIKEGNVF